MVEYRKIEQQDNIKICNIIRTTLEEFGGKREGTAYYDNDTERMFEAYQGEKEIYFVAIKDNEIVGGCGIKHLSNTIENIAELQKLYLLKEVRGLGIGKKLVEMCVEFAKSVGFESIYLETFPNMVSAQALYKKFGFDYLTEQLGGTGHSSCDIWMIKKF